MSSPPGSRLERDPSQRPDISQQRDVSESQRAEGDAPRQRLTDAPMLERAERTLEASARDSALEPAPGRLALGIMARLAQQTETQPRPRPASAALGLALALAVLVLLPLLGAIGWLILTSIGSPAALSGLVQRGMELLAALWNTLHALAADARALIAAYPELPLLTTLLPIGIFGIQRAARRQRRLLRGG